MRSVEALAQPGQHLLHQHLGRAGAGGDADAGDARRQRRGRGRGPAAPSPPARQPARSATSTRRSELEEFGAPTTTISSDPLARSPSPPPGGWWWRSRCPPSPAPAMSGKRSRSTATISAVSSTDSVVWVMKASGRVRRHRDRAGLRLVLHQGHGAVRQLAHGADHLRVAGMADQQDVAAAGEVLLGLPVHLADQRAGGVEVEQVAARRLGRDRFRHAMGGEHHRRRRPAPRPAPRRRRRPGAPGFRPRSGCARSRAGHRPARRSGGSPPRRS